MIYRHRIGANSGQEATMARDASVAVVKRVNGGKPQVCEAGSRDRVEITVHVEPVAKCGHFPFDTRRRWRLKVDALAVTYFGEARQAAPYSSENRASRGVRE
jgi:hypothetical protein